METFFVDGDKFIINFVRDYLLSLGLKQVFKYPADIVFLYGDPQYSRNLKNTKGSKLVGNIGGIVKSIITNKLSLSSVYSKSSFIPQFSIIYNKTSLIALSKKKKFFNNPKIIKPSVYGAGAYITISDKLNELVEWIEKYPRVRSWIVQDYIRSPALFQGFKFHIRLVLLVIKRNNDLPIELYANVYNRIVCAELHYKKSDWNNDKIHDTHVKRNKLSPFFLIENPDGWTSSESVKAFKNMIKIIKKIFSDFNDFRTDFGAKGNFELLGADFLFDNETKKPYLLEINDKMGLNQSQFFVLPSFLDTLLQIKNKNIIKIL